MKLCTSLHNHTALYSLVSDMQKNHYVSIFTVKLEPYKLKAPHPSKRKRIIIWKFDYLIPLRRYLLTLTYENCRTIFEIQGSCFGFKSSFYVIKKLYFETYGMLSNKRRKTCFLLVLKEWQSSWEGGCISCMSSFQILTH